MVDAALYESVLGIMECLVTEFQQTGQVRERSGPTLPGVAPSNVYACADGISVVIGANGNSVFARLCQAMSQPELASQGRFDTDEKRGALQDELDRIISEWTVRLPSASVLTLMRQFAVPAGLIYRAPEMLADPHFAARSAIIDVRDALLGTIKMQGVFPRLSATPGEVRWSGPTLGQHNEEIYRGLLGISAAELEDLQQSNVI
jgi:formyl-CoA transferase